MSQPIHTLIDSAWMVPVRPQGQLLSQHAIAIDQHGVIEAIGPCSELEQRFVAEQRVSLPRHVLIPGLVNAHTHTAMSLLRGIGDDMALMPWLKHRIWPTEASLIGPDFVTDGAALALIEMIRGGITCCCDMYFFPEAVAQVAQSFGFRLAVGLIVIDFPNAWASGADECLSRGLALHDEVKSNPLISTVLAPHAPYTVGDESFHRLRLLADQLDLPLTVHLHETADEIEQSRQQYQLRPLARLQRLGLVNERLVAVHMTQLKAEEIDSCARLGVHVVHCPESNLKLASGWCPVADLQDHGVNVALGTDGAASNNDLDLFGEMRTAALIGKGMTGDAEALPAATVLEMATLNGAKALGLEAQVGSLEVGKQADITAVDLDQPETMPVFDPLSHLVYACGRHQVSDVWIAGRQVLQARQLVGFDLDALKRRVQQWQLRISQVVAQQKTS